MKKAIVAIISVAIVLGLLMGCSSAPEAATESGKTPGEIIDNFEKMLEPIADQFQLSRQALTDLGDGKLCQPAIIMDKTLDRDYDLLTYFTESGGVYSTSVVAKKGNYTELNFGLLSYYLYKSLTLPTMDSQSFYDHFNMLTDAPSGSMLVDGWRLSIMDTETLLIFSARYDTK